MNSEISNEFFSRKERYLLKDLETAFSGYSRLINQVNSIHTWTITIMIACIGFLISTYNKLPIFVIAIPAMIALFAFLILELRERSSMRFNKNEVLEIEKILMITDDSKFNEALQNYRFRDLRLSELNRFTKLNHLCKSLINLQVVFWYLFWLIVFWAVVIILKFLS